MDIKQRVSKQLERLKKSGPKEIDTVLLDEPQRGYLIGVPPEGPGVGASLNIEDYDRYSASLRHLEIYDSSQKIEEAESYLRGVAEQLCQRLTYLDEPLTLVELDKTENIAQLRSELEADEVSEKSYWEIMVYSQPHPQAKLRRYHWSAGSDGRQGVSYPLTFGMLGRLAEDVARSLAEKPAA